MRQLPEFEVGDWKEKRRWRLLAFDGPSVTVADFDFYGQHVHSLEPSAVVRFAVFGREGEGEREGRREGGSGGVR